MKLKLTLDRYEEGLAVCLDENDKRYEIPGSVLGDMRENDIFTVEYDGETFSSPFLLREETEAVKESVSKRMSRLFHACKRREVDGK